MFEIRKTVKETLGTLSGGVKALFGDVRQTIAIQGKVQSLSVF
jgi:hypothetical protein